MSDQNIKKILLLINIGVDRIIYASDHPYITHQKSLDAALKFASIMALILTTKTGYLGNHFRESLSLIHLGLFICCLDQKTFFTNSEPIGTPLVVLAI